MHTSQPDTIVRVACLAEGVKAEEEFEKTGKVPDPNSTDNAEFKIILRLLAEGLKTNPTRFRKMAAKLVRFSHVNCKIVQSTTGLAHQLNRALPPPIRLVCLRRPPPVSSACTRCRRLAPSSSRRSTSTTLSPSARRAQSSHSRPPDPTFSGPPCYSAPQHPGWCPVLAKSSLTAFLLSGCGVPLSASVRQPLRLPPLPAGRHHARD